MTDKKLFILDAKSGSTAKSLQTADRIRHYRIGLKNINQNINLFSMYGFKRCA